LALLLLLVEVVEVEVVDTQEQVIMGHLAAVALPHVSVQ